MRNLYNRNDFKFWIFGFVSLLLCISYLLFLNPCYAEDSGAYILLAKHIYGIPTDIVTTLSHRSPFYSIILGLFMIIFDGGKYLTFLIYFQIILLWATGLVVYKVTFLLSGSAKLSILIGILSLLNISTIYFAYSILSEIVALFLFSSIVFLVIVFNKTGYIKYILLAGICSGLLVLDRFNVIGLPLVLIFVICSIHFVKFGRNKLSSLIKSVLYFLLPIIIILNAWSYYNYLQNGYYNLFPKQHYGQRWAIPATINIKNTVNEDYVEILRIFLNGKKYLQSTSESCSSQKSSLLNYEVPFKLNNYFQPDVNGFLLYSNVENQLLDYYKLENNPQGIAVLGHKIHGFYREIAHQNKHELFKLRIYSLLNTFRIGAPSSEILRSPGNLHFLPFNIIILYKIGFIIFISMTYIFSAFIIIKIAFSKRLKYNLEIFIVSSLIWYFPLVNFFANVLGDANRFKYPAESIIICLGIYFIWFGLQKSLIIHNLNQLSNEKSI